MKNQNGFMLLELMIVLAMVALLLLLSSPYIRQVLIRNRIERSVLALLQAINLGRRMAIDSNLPVVLCHSQDGETCSGRWSDGQILFFKTRGQALDQALDRENDIIRHWEGVSTQIEMLWHGFSSQDVLQFAPLGMGRAMNGSFLICWQGTEQRFNRAIIINRNGRARVSENDSQGNTVRC